MNMKAIYLSLFLTTLVIPTNGLADEDPLRRVTNDPMDNYMWMKGYQKSIKVMKVEFDFDGDGKNEVLITDNEALNGRAGNMWDVYIPMGKGYRRSDTIVSFRDDAFYAGYVEKLKGRAIVSFSPDGSEAGVITYIRVKNGVVEEGVLKIIKMNHNKESKDFEYFFGGFKKEPQVKSEVDIEKVSIKELLEKNE